MQFLAATGGPFDCAPVEGLHRWRDFSRRFAQDDNRYSLRAHSTSRQLRAYTAGWICGRAPIRMTVFHSLRARSARQLTPIRSGQAPAGLFTSGKRRQAAEDVFGFGADAEVGVGFGVEDFAGGIDDVGGGQG
jgi:hypothetical protein